VSDGKEEHERKTPRRTGDLTDLALPRIIVAIVAFLLISTFNPLGVKQNSESATQDFFETVFGAILPPAAITTPEEAYDHIRTYGPLSHRDHFEATANAFAIREIPEPKKSDEEGSGTGEKARTAAENVDRRLESQRRLRATRPLEAHPWAPIHLLRFDDVVMSRIHGDDPMKPRQFARHQLPLDSIKGLLYLLGRLKVSVIFLDIRLLTDTSPDSDFCGVDDMAPAEWKRSVRRPLRRGEADAPIDTVGNLGLQKANRENEKPFLFIAGLPTNRVLRGKKARTAEIENAMAAEAMRYFEPRDSGERQKSVNRILGLHRLLARLGAEPVWLPQRLRCLHDIARILPARWSGDDYPLGISFGDSNHQDRTIGLLGGNANAAPDLMPTPTPALEMFAAWCAHPNSIIRAFPQCDPNWNPPCADTDFDGLVGGPLAIARLKKKCAEPVPEAFLGIEVAAEKWATDGLVKATEKVAMALRRVALAKSGMKTAEELDILTIEQLVSAFGLRFYLENALTVLASDNPASVSADLPVEWLDVMVGLGLHLDPRLDPGRPINLGSYLLQRGTEGARQVTNWIDGTSEREQYRLAPRPYARSPELYQWLESDVSRRKDDDGVPIPDMSDIHGCRPELTFVDSNRANQFGEKLDHLSYLRARVSDEVFGNISGTKNPFSRGCSNIPMHEAFFTPRDWPLSARHETWNLDQKNALRNYMRAAFEGSAVVIAGNFDNASDVVPSNLFGSKIGAYLHAEALQCLLWYGADCPRRPDRLLFEFDLMDLLELATLILLFWMSRGIVRKVPDCTTSAGVTCPSRKILGLWVRRDHALGYRYALFACIPVAFVATGVGMAILPFPSADLLALLLVIGIVFREGVVGLGQMLLWHVASDATERECDPPHH